MANLTQIPAAALDGSARPDLNPCSISRAGTWSKCTALGYLRYVEHAETDFDAHYFSTGGIIHEGLEGYYLGEFNTPQEGVEKALRDLFAKHGQEDAYDKAIRAAEVDQKIIARFEKGEFKKKDGTLYTAPRMTNDYKRLVKEEGLDKLQEELGMVFLGKMKLPEGGVVEFVQRIKSLINRYARTRMIPREHFETIFVESQFDYVDVTPRGREIRLLGYMDLVGKLKPEHGGYWCLIDYKTGRAQANEEHQLSADNSLQLTLYENVLVKKWGIPREELKVALHFLDAAYEAPTTREDHHYQRLLQMLDAYKDIEGKPGMVKRLFYDDKTCQGCEYRSACVATFGDASCAPKNPAPLVAKSTEDNLDRIWD